MVNREVLEAQKELLASSFSQAQAYTNVILAAGYAGFFGVWGFVRSELTRGTVFWSALLVTISLAMFVAWEILGMYMRSRTLIGIAQAVAQPERFEELMLEYKRTAQERSIRFGRLWLITVVGTVTTGFGAFCILLSAFVHGLWLTYSGP
ncbi:MAG: hypothetical protein ACTHNM_18765 [Dyella sp.]|jgi:hypothetical protein|uniref:hypothetical protein n=1 Tax=Dyella sp. TaxID=1869338 RepID=UPI003F804DBB